MLEFKGNQRSKRKMLQKMKSVDEEDSGSVSSISSSSRKSSRTTGTTVPTTSPPLRSPPIPKKSRQPSHTKAGAPSWGKRAQTTPMSKSFTATKEPGPKAGKTYVDRFQILPIFSHTLLARHELTLAK
jgi:hypothetical protein